MRRVPRSITSPPYMNRWDHPENPLTGYRTLDGDDTTYLRELRSIWYQELALLYLLNHKGEYRNRMSAREIGDRVEVPWV